MKIKLLPKTKRLKELIKFHTNKWNIIDKKYVQCFDDIGFFIESIDKKHKRWITKDQFEKI